DAAESLYSGYLAMIPTLMAILNGPPDDFLANSSSLNGLMAKSPSLKAQVSKYREATDEVVRSQRRAMARQLKVIREEKPATEALKKLLESPPALPGQEGPGGL